MTDNANNLNTDFSGEKEAIAAVREACCTGDMRAAVRLCAEAVVRYPSSAELHAFNAHLLLWSGKHDKATAALAKACALGPDLAVTWAARADMAAFDGDLDEASSVAARAIEIDDEDSWVLESVIGIYSMNGLHDECIKLSRRRCELYPDSASAFAQYITTLGVVGRQSESDALVDEVEQRFPNSPLIQHKRARVLTRERRLGEAADLLSEAARKSDGSFTIWGEYAMVLAALGRLEDAEAAAQHALDISAISTISLNTMSNICRKRGQLEDAAEWAKKAKTAIPALSSLACLREANAALRTGKNKSVVKIIDASLDKLAPLTKRVALGIKARALLKMGNVNQLEATLAELQDMGDSSATLYFLKASLLAKRNNHAAAVPAFRSGLEKYPSDGSMRAGLLGSLHALGKADEEQALIEDIWAHLPQVPSQYAELIMALDSAGRKYESRELRTLGLEKFPNDEMLLLFLATDMAEAGDFAGAQRVAGNLKGDMREASQMVNRAATRVSKLEKVFGWLRKNKDDGGKPPTLN